MRADDVYALLKKKLEEMGISQEDIQKAVEIYLTDHSVNVNTDKTLSVENKAADAKITGEELDKKANGQGITFSINQSGGLSATYESED